MAALEPRGCPSGGHCAGARSPRKKSGEELGRRLEGSAREIRDEFSREQSPLWRCPRRYWCLLAGARLPATLWGARSEWWPSPRPCTPTPGPGPEQSPGRVTVSSGVGPEPPSRPPSLDLASGPKTGWVAPPAKAGLGGGYRRGFRLCFLFCSCH